jgi:enoyl-CoA hydratase/carnithine racemase
MHCIRYTGELTINISAYEQNTANPDDVVLFEVKGRHIALITLNRPAVRNAINGALAAAVARLVRLTEDDKDIRVVIITAAGGRAFCAGADLTEMAAGNGNGQSIMVEGGFAGITGSKRAKPWIAAVNGYAMGGGLEIVLACDVVVAGESASFALPEVTHGILAGAGGIYRLSRAIPRAVALEMLATGAPLAAKRAYEVGLVSRLTEDSLVLPEAMRVAEAIARNAPVSVRESLAVGRIAVGMPEHELLRLQEGATRRVMDSPDSAEGPRAFVEKRAPVWQS